jgi:type IV fimbrial biogenesis protein FimT
MRGSRGITLIELMIVVTLIGIIVALAAPRFGTMRLQWQVDAGAQQLVGDLSRARVEAVKRNDMVWLAKTSTTGYRIRFVGDRSLPAGVAFTSGPDTVKFAAFGPALTGATSYQLAVGTTTREVRVNAAGFASVH